MAKLDPESWQAVSPYLDEALTMDMQARAALVASLRDQNPSVAANLEVLLEERRNLEEQRFLEHPPADAPGRAGFAGQTVGAYRLQSPIGEGGMGAVWLAERSDGRFERQVALKFLKIALGRGGEERFQREGRILGRLAHPHVAQLLDAGVSSAGQPYLVLEYVDGEPIHQYCDRHMLDLEARIGLFLDVLDAVAHAHANLIVHRDLKPSNVLVSAEGQVKLLDFGIAKLVEKEGEAAATELTREAGGAMTLLYAAPEQVTGGAVTTATDVYALGVLLCVLLAGQHPAGPGPYSPAELIKRIVDIEPPPLADLFSKSEDAAARASQRASTPERLRRRLRGDLETIAAKAMKKNPAERYEGVGALAADLRRYRNHQPIEARPDTLPYRARKFLRRYWAPVAAAALVIASLAAGLYTTNRQRAMAERRFQQVRQLANQFLALDAKIQALPGATEARRQIVSTSIGYLEALRKEAGADPGLLLEIGTAYLQVARVQGVPTGSNLGDFEEADKTLAKAEEVIGGVTRADPRNRGALRASAEVAHDRMVLATGSDREASLARIRAAMDRIESWLAAGDATEQEITSAAKLVDKVANGYTLLGLHDDAIGSARRAVGMLEPLKSAEAQRGLGWALTRLAQVLYGMGDLQLALQTVRRARTLVDRAIYPGEVERKLALNLALATEGRILRDMLSPDRSEEAMEPVQKSFEMMDQLAAADPSDSISRYQEIISGKILAALAAPREPERSLAIYDRCLLRLRETRETPNRRNNEAGCLANSALVLLQLRRLPEAKRRIDAAFALLRTTGRYPVAVIFVERDRATMDALRARAAYEEQTGQPQRAAESYQELLDKVMAASPQPKTDLFHAYELSSVYEELARLYRSIGYPDRTRALDDSRVELWRYWGLKLPDNPLVLRHLAAAADPQNRRRP